MDIDNDILQIAKHHHDPRHGHYAFLVYDGEHVVYNKEFCKKRIVYKSNIQGQPDVVVIDCQHVYFD